MIYVIQGCNKNVVMEAIDTFKSASGCKLKWKQYRTGVFTIEIENTQAGTKLLNAILLNRRIAYQIFPKSIFDNLKHYTKSR